MKWGIISDNPCHRVDAPKADKKQIQFLDDHQALQFMKALEGESLEYRVVFSTLLLTGMRRGELLGLEWPDIDFDAGVIHIRRTPNMLRERVYTRIPRKRNNLCARSPHRLNCSVCCVNIVWSSGRGDCGLVTSGQRNGQSTRACLPNGTENPCIQTHRIRNCRSC